LSVLAIAFTSRPARESPNIRRRSSLADGRAADIYYRSLVVSFASVRRWNEHLPLLFVTDGETPQLYSSALRSLEVETEIVSFEHRPPAEFSQTHVASLYSLDALRALSTGGYGQVILLDPDVLCRGDLTPLLAGTKDKVGALPCGMTSANAVQLHLSLDETLGPGPSTFYEGACYVVDAMHFPVLLEMADRAWQLSLTNFATGLKYFTTEQDVLNFALRSVPSVSIRPYISTIWTTRTHRTVPPDVERLPLWHLPSEKDRAFARLFEAATNSTSWFWTANGERHAEMIRRVTQIPRRSAVRWTGDTGARLVRRLQRAMTSPEPTTMPSVSESVETGSAVESDY
jgi:hypothetical protein